MAVLTQNFVTNFTLKGRDEAVIRDQRLVGFCLRVRRKADGKLSKTYFVTRELPGEGDKRRRERIVIGSASLFTEEKAREEAQKMLQAVKAGDDPRAARKAKLEAPTWEDLIGAFDREHIASKSKGTQADYRGRIKRHLNPTFGGKRIADITRSEIIEWHEERGAEHPTDANRNLAIMSKMMMFSIGRKSWRETNPCAGIARYTETASDIWLDELDLPKFIAALAKITTPYGDLIRFLTVTGWRVSEGRKLRWEMLDLERGKAALPDTKTGPQDRWLSTDAVSILSAIGHRVGYVFSAKRNGVLALDYREVRGVLRAVCREAGIAEITPHALRRTAATWTAKEGGTTQELKQAFGWKTAAMADRYVKRAESLARQGVERAASAMNVLSRPTDANKQ